MTFEQNLGQADPSVRFLARARGFQAFLTGRGAVFALPRGTEVAAGAPGERPATPPIRDVLRMGFPGVTAEPETEGLAPTGGRSHYLLGRDPAKWTTGVPHYGQVLQRRVWPGIDVRWRGSPGGRLTYDFLVAAGADPAALAFSVEGAAGVEIDRRGNLLLRTGGGVLRHSRPVAWQDGPSGRTAVDARFVLEGDDRVGIRLGPHDRSRPLVVDPTVQFSTYLGGSSLDLVRAVGVDGSGAVYVAGATQSTNFPVSSALQGQHGADGGSAEPYDGFVTKYAADGSSVAYSTFLGGDGSDLVYGLAVESGGAAVVVGQTQSGNFPLANAMQSTRKGPADAFLARIEVSGASLTYSTYLGGTGDESANGVALDEAGAVFLAGFTSSDNFPTKTPFQQSRAGGQDVFVAKVSAAGTSMVWASYLGGASNEIANGVCPGPDGTFFVAGDTSSSAFPIWLPYQSVRKGSTDGFLARVAANGSKLLYSTYLGGSSDEGIRAVAADAEGSAWVTGGTYSSDFPVTSGLGLPFSGPDSAFVTKFSPDGSSLASSSFLGGAGSETGAAIAVDATGAASVAGHTTSIDFPVADAVQGTKSGAADAFVTTLSASGTAIAFSTYFGGSSSDQALAVVVDATGRTIVAGSTSSSDFPTQDPAQGSSGGGYEGFVFSTYGAPGDPVDLSAALTGFTSIGLSWTDGGGTRTGFEIERKVGAGAFVHLVEVAAPQTTHTDIGLDQVTTYTYRVRAVNVATYSGYSNEASATTPPPPETVPADPSTLAASVASPRRVDVTWQDNSDNEDFFLLARAEGAGLFATRATPRLGATSFADKTVLPGRTYSWKVKSANPIGSSFFSNVATVTMPSTLDVPLVAGKWVDRDSFGKDSLLLSGTMDFGADAIASSFDPSAHALSLRLGDFGASPLVEVAAATEGWVLRKGKYTWKSPKGAISRVKIVIDTVAETWLVKVSRFNFSTSYAGPLRVTLGVGTDAGYSEDEWIPGRRTGQFKFP